MNRVRQYSPLIWAGGALALFFVLFVILAAAGWPGDPDRCFESVRSQLTDTCYCERISDGLVRQPWNTWSNFSFIIVGLLLFLFVSLDRAHPRSENPMVEGGFYPILYSGVVLFLGPGSMFFHASMTAIGGLIDNVSMYLFVGFISWYNISRLYPHFRPPSTFNRYFWTSIAALTIITAALMNVDYGSTAVFVCVVAAAVVIQIGIWRSSTVQRQLGWSIAFLGVFVLSVVIWALSKTGGALCEQPRTLPQGHVLWHLGCALGTFLYAFSLRSERTIQA